MYTIYCNMFSLLQQPKATLNAMCPIQSLITIVCCQAMYDVQLDNLPSFFMEKKTTKESLMHVYSTNDKRVRRTDYYIVIL